VSRVETPPAGSLGFPSSASPKVRRPPGYKNRRRFRSTDETAAGALSRRMPDPRRRFRQVIPGKRDYMRIYVIDEPG
jgi:hypothetical protein